MMQEIVKSDEELTCDVIRALIIAAYAGLLRDVDVNVSGGAVVLSGRTCSYYLKQLAQEHAKSVAGVRNVDDHICVRGHQDVAELFDVQRTPR